jgi:hypothetical protein
MWGQLHIHNRLLQLPWSSVQEQLEQVLPPGARPSLPAGCFGSRILEASTLTITTSLGIAHVLVVY